jgi:hypothetical protein
METPFCMDLCKEASTDNWRRCLNDCHIGLANEAREAQEIAKGFASTRQTRGGTVEDNLRAGTVVAVGVILTAASIFSLIVAYKKQ